MGHIDLFLEVFNYIISIVYMGIYLGNNSTALSLVCFVFHLIQIIDL